MNDALYIAATGMQVQQLNLDTVANNLSNVSTPTFKAGRVNFVALMGAGDSTTPAMGLGTASSGVSSDFTASTLQNTGNPLDVAIQGRGFLEVVMPDGSRAFTRGGSLTVNKDSMLATASGQALKPEIQIPSNMVSLQIGSDGRVLAAVAGQSTPVEIGRLDMVDFINPGGLNPVGDGVYLPTDSSGEAVAGRVGEDGLGAVTQGAVETSNVQLNDEMVNLMLAQRAYELSSHVAQVADHLMDVTNGLQR